MSFSIWNIQIYFNICRRSNRSLMEPQTFFSSRSFWRIPRRFQAFFVLPASSESPPREAPCKLLDQKPKPLQLTVLLLMHRSSGLFLSFPKDDGTLYPIFTAKSSHPAEEAHFGHLYFCHDPCLLVIGEYQNGDKPLNEERYFFWLGSFFKRQEKHSYYCKHCSNLSIILPFNPTITHKLETKIPNLLYLRQKLTSCSLRVAHLFLVKNYDLRLRQADSHPSRFIHYSTYWM